MSFCKPTPTLFAAGCKLDKDDGEIKTNATIYKSMIGCLLYLWTLKLNIMYATSLLSWYMQEPSVLHMKVVKRILRYIRGTLTFGLKFVRQGSNCLQGHCDSDCVGSKEDSKSTSSYYFSFGSAIFS